MQQETDPPARLCYGSSQRAGPPQEFPLQGVWLYYKHVLLSASIIQIVVLCCLQLWDHFTMFIKLLNLSDVIKELNQFLPPDGGRHSDYLKWIGVILVALCVLCCIQVTVNGVDYQPQSPSPNKKHAKAMAATVALQALGEVLLLCTQHSILLVWYVWPKSLSATAGPAVLWLIWPNLSSSSLV